MTNLRFEDRKGFKSAVPNDPKGDPGGKLPGSLLGSDKRFINQAFLGVAQPHYCPETVAHS